MILVIRSRRKTKIVTLKEREINSVSLLVIPPDLQVLSNDSY